MATSKNNNINDELAMHIFTVISVAALIVVRFSLFYFESFDYEHSLSQWVLTFQGMTFFEGLGTRVGNYNAPYMYILNIIARIGFSDLFLIKLVSTLFDFLLAFFVMKIIALKSESKNIRLLAFILALSIPTVLLNSSMWGQCDAIYASFALGGVYFALKGHSKKAFAFIALAVSFKLQAAFLLPLFAVFIFTKKIRLQDCYIFFLVFFAMLLPAIVAGYPIIDLLNIYVNQTDTYHYLRLNAVNVWTFVGTVEFDAFRTAGLYAGGVAVLGLMYYAFVNRFKLTDKVLHLNNEHKQDVLDENNQSLDINDTNNEESNDMGSDKLFVNTNFIRLAYLFAILIPFLLPQMHDRFFYMADVFSLLVFLFDKRRWYVPLVTIFCSYLTYAWMLMNWVYIFDLKYTAIALTLVIFVVLRDLVVDVSRE
jgi:Gpi18-like mannosyltransferase